MTARTEWVHVRMSEQEKQDLETVADMMGENSSDFIRAAIAERIERLVSADARRISEATN